MRFFIGQTISREVIKDLILHLIKVIKDLIMICTLQNHIAIYENRLLRVFNPLYSSIHPYMIEF